MRDPHRQRRHSVLWAIGAPALAFALVGGVIAPATAGHAATNRIYNLASISCVSATDCFVVGSSRRYDGGSQPSATFIARWNGSKWSIMPSANPNGHNMNALSDISCTAVDFCLAVGTASTTSHPATEQPLVEQWSGKSWRLVPSPVKLRQISCTKKNFCMAVGSGTARWDGVKLVVVPMVRFAAGQVFRVVSCLTGEACFAAGDYSNANGYTNHIAERWNGNGWSVTPSQGSGYGYFGLSGLTCAKVNACMGAGTWTDGLYSNEPYAQRWNGTAWSENRPAGPSDAIVSQLNGIACPSPTSCFASGDYHSGPGPAGYRHPFIDHWHGTKWSVAQTPSLYGGLGDVSCPSPTMCLAVGFSQQLGPGPNPELTVPKTLALRWDGKTWTRVPTPNPV